MGQAHSARPLYESTVCALEDALYNQKVVSFLSGDKLAFFLEELNARSLHCAPVLDQREGQYFLVDITDVIKYFLSIHPEHNPECLEAFLENTLGAVIEFSGCHISSVQRSFTLAQIIEGVEKSHCHAVLVRPDDFMTTTTSAILNIITQSTVVQYIHRHKKDLIPDAKKTLEELNLGTKFVSTVQESDSLISAFQQMMHEGLRCVGVMNKVGLLTCSLSSTTFTGTRHTNFSDLYLKVGEFLEKRRISAQDTCSPTSSIGDVVHVMATRHLHRLFITDSAGALVGVITLTDILDHLRQQHK